ncbi:MAG: DUF3106 domain-containing protein [Candidatus Accumulibacter sp.]|nr:DUF3106 domain-containing protein [Accumulibacter sp.]
MIFVSTACAAPESASLMATPPQPAWNELTVQQKIVLAPLSDTWDSMEHSRRKRWLGISNRFSSQSPAEQRRIQAQMQAWERLTFEQRKEARKNFKTARQLPREKKQELKRKWAEYSNLSDAEKLKFLNMDRPATDTHSLDSPILPEVTP